MSPLESRRQQQSEDAHRLCALAARLLCDADKRGSETKRRAAMERALHDANWLVWRAGIIRQSAPREETAYREEQNRIVPFADLVRRVKDGGKKGRSMVGSITTTKGLKGLIRRVHTDRVARFIIGRGGLDSRELDDLLWRQEMERKDPASLARKLKDEAAVEPRT